METAPDILERLLGLVLADAQKRQLHLVHLANRPPPGPGAADGAATAIVTLAFQISETTSPSDILCGAAGSRL